MVTDTLRLVNPPAFDREKLARALDRRTPGPNKYNNNSQYYSSQIPQLAVDMAGIVPGGKEELVGLIKGLKGPGSDMNCGDNHNDNDSEKNLVLGNYERIAPGPQWKNLEKMKAQMFRSGGTNVKSSMR